MTLSDTLVISLSIMQHDMTNNLNTKVSYIPVTSVSSRQHNRLILRLRSKQIMKVSYNPVTSVNIMQHISLSQSSQKPQTIQTLLRTITSPTDACTTCVHLSKIGIFISSHFQTTFSCFETNVQWPWYIPWHRKKYSRD